MNSQFLIIETNDKLMGLGLNAKGKLGQTNTFVELLDNNEKIEYCQTYPLKSQVTQSQNKFQFSFNFKS